MITIKDRAVTFTPKVMGTQMFKVAECLGFTTAESGEITADLNKVFKRALAEWMQTYFYDDLKDKSITDSIKQIYSAIAVERTEMIRTNVPWAAKLRMYQGQDVIQMMGLKHALLAYGMRLGKTITAFSLAEALQMKKILYVSPNNIKYSNYRSLTDEWGIDPLLFTLKDASKSKSFNAFFMNEKYMFINYDILKKHKKDIENFSPDFIIYDEVHHIKTLGTARSKNVMSIFSMFPDAHTIGLSGTPMANRVVDLFAYMHMTEHPLGKVKAEFDREFSLKEDDKVVGVQNVPMLRLKMSNFMIRRTVHDCGYSFPDEINNKIYFDVEEYRKEYNDEVRKIQELPDDVDAMTINAHITTMNRLNSYAKIPAAIEYIENLIENGEKVVVGTLFHDTLDRLQQHFKERCVRIDGQVTGGARDALRRRFDNDKDIDVAICQLAAAGEGVDMAISSSCVIMDLPWTSRVLDQFRARIVAEGKSSPVNTYFLLVPDSIDDYIYSVVANKANDINAVIDGGKQYVVKYDDVPQQIFKKLRNDTNTK